MAVSGSFPSMARGGLRRSLSVRRLFDACSTPACAWPPWLGNRAVSTPTFDARARVAAFPGWRLAPPSCGGSPQSGVARKRSIISPFPPGADPAPWRSATAFLPGGS